MSGSGGPERPAHIARKVCASVVEELVEHAAIDADRIAGRFAARYICDPVRVGGRLAEAIEPRLAEVGLGYITLD